MTPAQVNLLNIGLMLAALAAAFAMPFELFLFAYAVLGPLHYLTEISWLHDRRYFARGPTDAIALAGLAALIVLGAPLAVGRLASPLLLRWNGALVFFAAALALIFVLSNRPGPRAICAVLAAAAASALVGTRLGDIGFSLFVPTIIHVFVFTGVFILVGSVRSRSSSGFASLAVFLACAAACLCISPEATRPVGATIRAIYPLGDLNCRLVEVLGLTSPEPGASAGSLLFPFASVEAVFEHEASWRITRLIAFAYTYHYLNWFSKTRVIGWHDVPRRRMICILLLWVASVALYAHDFLAGLGWLFFLSLAHVFLEFPLNWRSFGELLVWARTRRSAAQA